MRKGKRKKEDRKREPEGIKGKSQHVGTNKIWKEVGKKEGE